MLPIKVIIGFHYIKSHFYTDSRVLHHLISRYGDDRSNSREQLWADNDQWPINRNTLTVFTFQFPVIENRKLSQWKSRSL